MVNYVKTLCEPLAAEKALHFTVELDADVASDCCTPTSSACSRCCET